MGSVELLKMQIDRGRPAPLGYLHHGTPDAPSGGGHYLLGIGYDDTHLIAHDPYGELDLVSGTWCHKEAPMANTSGTAGRTGPHAGP